MARRQNGFTLVEIAIVLVIIGLLLGGVLKGQELISQAKIKNVVADFDGVTAAIYSYQDRYKRLPGDDPGATRWTVAGSAINPGSSTTAGNNVLDGTGYASTTATDENRLFWTELRMAGFVSGGDMTSAATASSQPLNAAGGILGVQSGGLGLSGLVVCSGSLPAKIAGAIDAQLDDGNATTGNVRALLETTPPTAVTATLPNNAENYVDNNTNLYVVCKNI